MNRRRAVHQVVPFKLIRPRYVTLDRASFWVRSVERTRSKRWLTAPTSTLEFFHAKVLGVVDSADAEIAVRLDETVLDAVRLATDESPDVLRLPIVVSVKSGDGSLSGASRAAFYAV